jgi:hypothetical protein
MSFVSQNTMLLTTSPLEDKRRILTEKVRQLANLPIGFSHGEGRPVTGIAISCAENFINLASQLELEADVFPNLDGGCAVAFYKNSEKIEVSINPEGDKANLIFERGIGFQFEDVIPPMENVGITEILDQALKLRGLNSDIWKLSASSISDTLTATLEGSEILSARMLQNQTHPPLLQTEEAGSQYLILPVPA